MASKINPWRSLRSLAVRTRPSGPHHPHVLATTTTRASVPYGRRGLTDTTSMRSPPEDAELPPSDPPQEYQLQHQPPPFADNFLNREAIEALEQAAAGEDAAEILSGLKFGMPPPPGKKEKLQDRHHPVVHQVTRMLMRDGKLSKAEKHLSLILNHLRTSPPPKVSPLRPLLPGAPPAEQLPLNPLLYLTLAIESVAPIVRIRSLKGMAGGGAALELPEPINARTRRRQAILWILDIVNKKQSVGSGKKQFAARFGQEIVAVVEGRSAAWDRRQQVHKQSTSARANLANPAIRGAKKKSF
ncbi:ribosomal protein S7 domain-containing protein [Astrocystis sublimbata]|nr:ribosomal protein S7 domain-containing protein [Astrocystis sublimbata]KAI0198424.1 ribosomal protein S7 domain-containing protein [Astrocystis sublimbata]